MLDIPILIRRKNKSSKSIWKEHLGKSFLNVAVIIEIGIIEVKT